MHDGVQPFTTAQHNAIQNFVNAIVDGTRIPNAFVAYGNSKRNDIYVKTAGTQSNGSPVPSNPYFRMASTTKIICPTVAAKLMADRWCNMDTPIANYLGNGYIDASGVEHGDVIRDFQGNPLTAPWKSVNRKVIDTSGVVITMVESWNRWCDAQKPPVPKLTATGASTCPDLNVGHCLNMTSGLPYDYWTIGKYQGLLPYVKDNSVMKRIEPGTGYGYSDYLTCHATGQIGDTSAGYTMPPPQFLFDASGNSIFTMDTYVSLLTCQPSSSAPGVFCEYNRGYDLLGFFFDQLIKQNLSAIQAFYGNNTNIVDVISFAQEVIFKPIGANDTWVLGGQSQPPADVRTNMISASFQRSKTSSLGSKCVPYGLVDTSQNGLVSVTGVPVAKYSYTDLSGFTFTGYFDASNNALTVWADSVPGDTNTSLLNNSVYENKNNNLKHVGPLGSAWNMSAMSFAKLLRLWSNQGYDVASNTRIINKATMLLFNQASVTNGTYIGLTDFDNYQASINRDEIPLEYSFATSLPMLWSYGSFRFMNPGSMPNNTPFIAGFNTNLNTLGTYPLVEGVQYWTGVFNNVWYMDPNTGNFAVWGSSQPTWAAANSSLYDLAKTHIVGTPQGNAVPSGNNQPYASTRLISILEGGQQ